MYRLKSEFPSFYIVFQFRVNTFMIFTSGKYHTRGLPKCPKIAATEIGHLHDYAYRCQNAPFLFSLWNEAFWHRWLERDHIDVEMPKCPIFSHVLVTDAKMPHFKGKKEMVHFGVGMHFHASDLSLSQSLWGILATLVYPTVRIIRYINDRILRYIGVCFCL